MGIWLSVRLAGDLGSDSSIPPEPGPPHRPVRWRRTSVAAVAAGLVS